MFAKPQRAEAEWFERTRIFPIMHLLGIRRTPADAHPWLPLALAKLEDTSATKVTLPFVEEQLAAAQWLMGRDFWSNGLVPNHHVLERFLRQHHAEGLSSHLLAPEEPFHPASLEMHRI